MKYFTISVDVVKARGTQIWEVKALDKEDALDRFHRGEGNCVEQELEVIDIGTAEVLED